MNVSVSERFMTDDILGQYDGNGSESVEEGGVPCRINK
jgi:hypothetical protein